MQVTVQCCTNQHIVRNTADVFRDGKLRQGRWSVAIWWGTIYRIKCPIS